MQIEFFGAAGEVTGSCHILTVNGKRLLLDCGMIQGGKKNEERNRLAFPFDAKSIDAVILSHSHLDHSGRLPLLVRRGFRGPIYTQNASSDLTEVLLLDAASLGERDTERRNRKRMRKGLEPLTPLYSTDDAQQVLGQLKGFRYHEDNEVLPGITVRFSDAGHIMGSSIVELTLEENGDRKRLVFSGDLGQYDTPILRDPETIEHADAVIMESTYGGRVHRDRDSTYAEIGEIIQSAAAGKGNIIIPAFAIGRSQELLYLFGRHYDEWGMDRWRIFLDSPMAIRASKIYWEYPHLYDGEATKLRKGIDEMPPLPNMHFTRTADESRVINRMKSGAIVLAGSGMCNGGRILHHLKHNVWRPEAHIMIVGYQAVGSLGRRLVDRQEKIRIHGESMRLKATVHTVGGLSAHADEEDLSRWYSGFKNKPPVYLVHGEKKSGKLLRDKLKRHGARVTLTKPGMRREL